MHLFVDRANFRKICFFEVRFEYCLGNYTNSATI